MPIPDPAVIADLVYAESPRGPVDPRIMAALLPARQRQVVALRLFPCAGYRPDRAAQD